MPLKKKTRVKAIKAWAVVFNGWMGLEDLSRYNFSQFPLFSSREAARHYAKVNFNYPVKVFAILITPIIKGK